MTTAPDALISLELALNNLAAALVTGRSEAVLAAEGPLRLAVDHLVQMRMSGVPMTGSATDIRARIKAIRIATLKCRALGAASETLCRLVMPDAAYSGRGPRPAVTHSTLESRA